MSVISGIVVPLIVGWLSTLIMHRDLDRVSWFEFAIAVAGAGAAAALFDRCLAISLTGPWGLSFAGTLGAACGALAMLAAANLARCGKLRSDPPPPRICWRQSLHGWQQGSTDL